ncbi:glycoside hydrolase family 2 protein [Cohnella soli]|uniref:beta-mannosidase n=1 Tax=Cohnella soli TaxID=425005 RepID=A0ABW0HT39_9BACL
MRTISLDGLWDLYYFPQGELDIARPAGLQAAGLKPIQAAVPGNVELDLCSAGLLPDPYVGENIHLLKKYETFEWWYQREFSVESISTRLELVFHGVDCLATYWLDGQEIGRSDNMLIEHRFGVTDLLQPGRVHVLTVRLQSPVIAALGRTYDPSSFALPVNFEQLWIRKAAHSFGWDIFGRALSAGLWRSVELVCHERNEIVDMHFVTMAANERLANVRVFYQLAVEPRTLSGMLLRIRGTCGDSSFELTRGLKFAYGTIELTLEQPKLWWPRGYGEANLYTVTTELLYEGNVLSSRTDMLGIRTLKLLRSDVTTLERPGQFQFVVNSVPIMIKGSNWVPMDLFHSRDAGKYAEAVALAADLECNMLRCWGGGVYEDHAFFDLCDRSGILVWQDFAMACAIYPQDLEFQNILRKEALAVVRKLRNHPSLAVWAGDNECDEIFLDRGLDPNDNVLTRKVLKDAVFQCDPYRPYVPSSPYISPEAYRLGTPDSWPERHLWGPRDYFKSRYYTSANMHFIGETGYHGCPNLSSMERFLDPGSIWPWQDNHQWITHGTDPVGDPDSPYRFRVQLMADQIYELFGVHPDNVQDFILASQISQAEAKKFFIEKARLNKGRCGGILWWNLLDGWPQFSDAVVDYYGRKKLAYHYIKRVQQPVCIMIDEPENWHVTVKVSNDSVAAASGPFRIWDADSGETIHEGTFSVEANGLAELAKIRAPYSVQRLLLIEWTVNGESNGNHYMMGSPGFSLERYRGWLDAIASLPHAYDAAQLGK